MNPWWSSSYLFGGALDKAWACFSLSEFGAGGEDKGMHDARLQAQRFKYFA